MDNVITKLHNGGYGSKDKTDILKYDSETLNCPTYGVVEIYIRPSTYTTKDIFWVVDYFSQGPLAGNRCQVCELNRVKCVVSNTVNPSLDPFNISVSFVKRLSNMFSTTT